MENFLLVLGVRVSSVEASFAVRFSVPLETLVNAGPRRLTTGELSSFKACRLVLTFPVLLAALSNERGVKNLLNERGVTGGGRLGLRRVPASDTIEGGDDGISCREGTWTGSDRGIAEGPGVLTIVLEMNVKRRAAWRQKSNRERRRETARATRKRIGPWWGSGENVHVAENERGLCWSVLGVCFVSRFALFRQAVSASCSAPLFVQNRKAVALPAGASAPIF